MSITALASGENIGDYSYRFYGLKRNVIFTRGKEGNITACFWDLTRDKPEQICELPGVQIFLESRKANERMKEFAEARKREAGADFYKKFPTIDELSTQEQNEALKGLGNQSWTFIVDAYFKDIRAPIETIRSACFFKK